MDAQALLARALADIEQAPDLDILRDRYWLYVHVIHDLRGVLARTPGHALCTLAPELTHATAHRWLLRARSRLGEACLRRENVLASLPPS